MNKLNVPILVSGVLLFVAGITFLKDSYQKTISLIINLVNENYYKDAFTTSLGITFLIASIMFILLAITGEKTIMNSIGTLNHYIFKVAFTTALWSLTYILPISFLLLTFLYQSQYHTLEYTALSVTMLTLIYYLLLSGRKIYEKIYEFINNQI